MELLRERIDVSKRWLLKCCMLIHYLITYGLKHLIVLITSIIDILIDLSRTRPPLRLGAALKSEVTHFRVFGSRAWARIPFKKRKTLDPQSIECIFVGYPDGVKGY